MQQGLTETSNQAYHSNNPQPTTQHASQHGLPRSQPSLYNDLSQWSSRSASPGAPLLSDGAASGVNAYQLDQRLGRLNIADSRSATGSARSIFAGQRISEYENAIALSPSRQSPRPALGFKVVKRPGSPSHGVQLMDFPNEILTHILSHLHPDSHGAVALVSKRFYALVTTPYAWRTAFLRCFPGQDALTVSHRADPDADTSDTIRSEFRSFTRLTSVASWRSEYLLRTRLLRSVARGKPGAPSGSIGSSARTVTKKASAVLTYNSKLPWMITNVHAVFTSGKKGPRVIHGSADLGVATVSDPTIGKVEKWGMEDPFSAAQLDEMFPDLEPYGLGEGPAAIFNIMDVSQPYGMLTGEGFPGGRVFFRATGELRGRYLGHDSAIIDMEPEIPKIPELVEGITSVWIAKSSAVPSTTQSMVGILSGSSLGVVTSYSLGYESSGPRYSNGDIAARWVLSPGVPIIDIKVDDNYNQKRKSLKRLWAVALNALGEVYYLTETPTPPTVRAKGEDAVREAWHNGRTVYWELIESTRRTARPDEFDKNATRGAYSPRSPANSMNLSKEQIVAEAKEIEKFLRHKPAHFRSVCEGWDMRRRLEVDFAGGDENGIGEAVFVITCGHEDGEPAGVRRYVRSKVSEAQTPSPGALTPVSPEPKDVKGSIFGGPAPDGQVEDSSPELGATIPPGEVEDWRCAEYSLGKHEGTEITTSAIDLSTYAAVAAFEDPLHSEYQGPVPNNAGPTTTASKNATGEIPGRRSRLLAVGTAAGSVIAWNMRESLPSTTISPIRVIHTESPKISSIALSALYLVHGGSDGLVQAWDPLASTLEPIRTLSAKSSGRIPRHILNLNPALQNENYFAVGAIYLDPDPAVLRGVLSFGTFLRFWTYSATSQAPGRKRRLRHSDIHGRLASRRHFGTVSGYIAAEEAELRHEQQERSRETARLRKRFGVGLGDLTEEEAIRYAEMISQESFMMDEQQRRLSASDTGGSAADMGETASSLADSTTTGTITPEPSLSGRSSGSGVSGASISGLGLPPVQEENNTDDDEFEAQIQRALRLSLMEGVNDMGQSPQNHSSSCEYEFFQVKGKGKDKKKRSACAPPSPSPSASSTPVVQFSGESSRGLGSSLITEASGSSPSAPQEEIGVGVDEDADFALALRLSMEEEEAAAAARQRNQSSSPSRLNNNNNNHNNARLGIIQGDDEYPPLLSPGNNGKGKGKWV